jgi:hypothetical protein
VSFLRERPAPGPDGQIKPGDAMNRRSCHAAIRRDPGSPATSRANIDFMFLRAICWLRTIEKPMRLRSLLWVR